MVKYLEVGQIVNTFGIKGQVKVKPFTDDIKRFDKLKEVYVDKDGTTTTIWEAPEEEQKAYLSEEHTEPLG